MTTTIAQGTSAAVSVLKGYTLKTTGNGIAVVNNQPTGLNGSVSIGPFDRDQVVNVSAIGSAVSYSIETKVTPALTQDASGQYIGEPAFAQNSKNAAGQFQGLLFGGATVSNNGTLDIRSKGAKCDGQFVNDGVIATISGNSRSLTSASGLFTAADVGKVGSAIAYAAGQQFGYDFTVTAYVSPTVLTINCTNGGIVSSQSCVFWGTDDSVAIDAALTAAGATTPKQNVFFPCAITCSAKATQHTVPDGVSLVGTGNLTTVDYSYKLSPVGSWVVLCKFTGAFFFALGSTGSASSLGSNVSNMTIDGMNLCGVACYDGGRASQRTNATFLRSTSQMALVGGSGVMTLCTVSGAEQAQSLKIGGGDSRVINNYIYGSGPGVPCVKIEGNDVLFAENHLWKDSDVDPTGPLVQCNFFDGSSNGGSVTIDANQFDTAVGANIEINITGNTTVRCINIIGNHSILNDAVQNNKSAVIPGANITIANASPTMVIATGLTSGTIYLGCIFTGTNIPANTRVIAQTAGTPGGIGTYTLSNNASGTASGTYNCAGFPYITINIAAGSTLRMLNVIGNTGMGSWNDPTKSMYANFIDGTGIAGSLLCLRVGDNQIDDCGLGFGSAGTVNTFLTPTATHTPNNHYITNSASTTPVAF